MIDFIPIHEYVPYFHYTILCMIIVAFWQCHTGSVLKNNTVNMNATWGILFTILLILYMGLRPVMTHHFGDTVNYAKHFFELQKSTENFQWSWNGEWLFYNLISWFAKYSDIHTFFLLCATIYVGSLWLACVRIFKNYYYIPFLVILSMFTFWDYGVNGVRNGLGASVFILAMTYVNKPTIMIIIALLACGFHKSIYMMLAASILAWFFKKTNWYLIGWGASVIISYIAGFRIQNYIAQLGIGGDDKFTGYLTGDNLRGEIVQMSMVFRWDFLAYSAMAVAVGYFFIFRKNFKDEYYHWIYNTFLITNAFWVLIIRSAYTNRFAQISWFIMPLVLIYPFLKKRFWTNHEKMLGFAILLFYAFEFYYNVLR